VTTIEHAVAREAALDSARGWVIVTLGVCMLTLIWGIVFTFTVYADRLAATFGLTAVQVSSVFSTTSAALLAIGGLFGVFAARVTLRPVLALVAAGLAVVSIALLQIADSFAGVVPRSWCSGTAGGTAFTIIISLAPQWFDEYQGLAMSITMTGVGLGPLVMPQAWLWLFERTSFQTGFAAVVGLTAVFVGASSLVYRRPPGTARDSNPVGPGWVRRRLSDRHFLSTAVGFPLVFTWFYVLSAHLVDIPHRERTVSGWALPPPVSVLSAVSASSPESRVGMSAIASASSRHFSRAPDSLACAPSYFRSFTRPCWPTLRSSVSGSRSGHSPRLVADHSHCVWTGERDRDGRLCSTFPRRVSRSSRRPAPACSIA